METIIRKRKGNGDDCQAKEKIFSSVEEREKIKKRDSNGFAIFALLTGIYAAVWMIVHIRISQFPTPLDPLKAEKWDFVEARARKYLEDITSFGPRVAGSEGSKFAAEYILEEINKIIASANPRHTIIPDVQTVSGSFIMDMETIGIGTYSSVYENQTNIIVRIGPKILKHSLLINCHFDSVVSSPGK